MRIVLSLITGLCLFGSAIADTGLSKQERRNQNQAQKQYLAAIEFFRSGNIAKGRTLLDNAFRLDPKNSSVLTARELLRQQEIQQRISDANQLLAANQREQAIDGFRKALALDWSNAAAQEGLRSALAEREAAVGNEPRIRYRDADDIRLQPSESKQDFHFKGDSRG